MSTSDQKRYWNEKLRWRVESGRIRWIQKKVYESGSKYNGRRETVDGRYVKQQGQDAQQEYQRYVRVAEQGSSAGGKDMQVHSRSHLNNGVRGRRQEFYK